MFTYYVTTEGGGGGVSKRFMHDYGVQNLGKSDYIILTSN